jgi:hypothetical protein
MGRLPRDTQSLRNLVLQKVPTVKTNVHYNENGEVKTSPNLLAIPRHLVSNPNIRRTESFVSVGQILRHVERHHPGIFENGVEANLSSDGVPLSQSGSHSLRVSWQPFLLYCLYTGPSFFV